MLTGTNLQYTKAHNYRTVLETVRVHGPIARADIARRTALTAQTVSNIVKKLTDGGLVREAAKRQNGRGAPSITLEIDPHGAYSIGLDLDRDHLTALLVDLTGTVRQREHQVLSFPDPDDAVDLMGSVCQSLVEAENLALDDVSGVGVGFPGPIEVSRDDGVTRVANPTAFPKWENVPVVDLLTDRLGLPIYLENNATAAAVGERWYGEDQISNFFYLLFSVGLGGGIVIDGQPYEGFTGNAGELGYIPAAEEDDRPKGGLPPHAGEKPHVGEHFHLPQLYNQLQKEGADVSAPDDLLPLYKRGNRIVHDWVDKGVQNLTTLLLLVEYLIDPEAIYFGGQLPDPIVRDMLERVERGLAERRIRGKTSGPDLKLGTAGRDAAALGVATLPIYEIFAPIPRLLMKNQAVKEVPSLSDYIAA
jgi:predicted NBD/HSP70 family sugar kinase